MPTPDQLVLAEINRLTVEHEVIEIDPEYADTAAFCEKYGYGLERSANTILVASKKQPRTYSACVILATTRLDVNKRVRKLMGVSRASFASADEMKEVTRMLVGGLTPFGLPEDIPLYVDDRVYQLDWVILGGGSRAIKIKISPDVFEKLAAERITDLANPIPTE